jgi:hypothetical protein
MLIFHNIQIVKNRKVDLIPYRNVEISHHEIWYHERRWYWFDVLKAWWWWLIDLRRYNSLNLVTRVHVNFSQYSDCQKSKSWLDPISKHLNFTSWYLENDRWWYWFDGLRASWRWHINWRRYNSLNFGDENTF